MTLLDAVSEGADAEDGEEDEYDDEGDGEAEEGALNPPAGPVNAVRLAEDAPQPPSPRLDEYGQNQGHGDYYHGNIQVGSHWLNYTPVASSFSSSWRTTVGLAPRLWRITCPRRKAT